MFKQSNEPMKKDLSGNSNLAVQQESFKAVDGLKEIQSKLDQLAPNPDIKAKNDAGLRPTLERIGMPDTGGADFLLLGALGSFATNMMAGALGVQAAGLAANAIDVGSSMIAERTASQRHDAPAVTPVSSKKDAKTQSVFKPKFKRSTPAPTRRAAPAPVMGNTSMMQNGMKSAQRRAFKRDMPMRQKLEAQKENLTKEAEVYAFYRQQGIYDIYDAPEAGGLKVQTKKDGQYRIANQHTKRELTQEAKAAPQLRRARPQLSLGM